MKNHILILAILITCISCKQNKKIQPEIKSQTLAEKITNANGIENWKNVSEIDFTFNVDRDTIHFERSWSWQPKTGDVTLISGKDTISYKQMAVDSTSLNADKSLINDSFWLLAPFHLVWDKGTTISDLVKEEAPMSKTIMNKITLTYPNQGGYTPGDAYDFYFGDDYLVKEWIYRKGNSKEPSMITSWDNYQDFNGLKIAKEHKNSEGNFKLYFTNVKVVFN
ncbi:hypothetical protein GCM10007962_21260 [Yeosuana aromativorans]|uniref:Uncharacterized protein n=1 Tax=Yeosuana aromativorans TaxID=288019 RepID=A0A8J3BTD4_9FLAO|nr:hypothetical protein [Yeosuana aromativorans]GGK26734.1 hypothetical protein GCM10007962_21260 [Yeosuana aromativorans]